MKYIDVKDGRIPAIGFGTFDIRGEDCVRATAMALENRVKRLSRRQKEAIIDGREALLDLLGPSRQPQASGGGGG